MNNTEQPPASSRASTLPVAVAAAAAVASTHAGLNQTGASPMHAQRAWRTGRPLGTFGGASQAREHAFGGRQGEAQAKPARSRVGASREKRYL